MEEPNINNSPKLLQDNGTQAEVHSNKGKRLNAIQEDKPSTGIGIQKQQQVTKSKLLTTSKRKQNTNWLKNEEGKMMNRPRTPKKPSPGEVFANKAKEATLQTRKENRSFLLWETTNVQPSETIKIVDIDGECNPGQQILASNDPKLFMCTSRDSPPVNMTQEKVDITPENTEKIFKSHK